MVTWLHSTICSIAPPTFQYCIPCHISDLFWSQTFPQPLCIFHDNNIWGKYSPSFVKGPSLGFVWYFLMIILIEVMCSQLEYCIGDAIFSWKCHTWRCTMSICSSRVTVTDHQSRCKVRPESPLHSDWIFSLHCTVKYSVERHFKSIQISCSKPKSLPVFRIRLFLPGPTYTTMAAKGYVSKSSAPPPFPVVPGHSTISKSSHFYLSIYLVLE